MADENPTNDLPEKLGALPPLLPMPDFQPPQTLKQRLQGLIDATVEFANNPPPHAERDITMMASRIATPLSAINTDAVKTEISANEVEEFLSSPQKVQQFMAGLSPEDRRLFAQAVTTPLLEAELACMLPGTRDAINAELDHKEQKINETLDYLRGFAGEGTVGQAANAMLVQHGYNPPMPPEEANKLPDDYRQRASALPLTEEGEQIVQKIAENLAIQLPEHVDLPDAEGLCTAFEANPGLRDSVTQYAGNITPPLPPVMPVKPLILDGPDEPPSAAPTPPPTPPSGGRPMRPQRDREV